MSAEIRYSVDSGVTHETVILPGYVTRRRGWMKLDGSTMFTRGGVGRTIVHSAWLQHDIRVTAINPDADTAEFSRLVSWIAHAVDGGLFRLTLPSRLTGGLNPTPVDTAPGPFARGFAQFVVPTPGLYNVGQWVRVQDDDDLHRVYIGKVSVIGGSTINVSPPGTWPMAQGASGTVTVCDSENYPNAKLVKEPKFSGRDGRSGGRLYDLDFTFRITREADNAV